MNDEKNSFSTSVNPDNQREVRYVPVEIINTGEQSQVNLLDLVKIIWDERRSLRNFIIFFLLFGLFNYFFGPKEFESTSVLIQESRTASSQTQQILQRLSGINFGDAGQSEIIPPSLYPRIVYSSEFQRDLLYEVIAFEGDNYTLFEYFNQVYEPPVTKKTYQIVGNLTIRLPVTIIQGIRYIGGLMRRSDHHADVVSANNDEQFLALSREEQKAIQELRDRITIELEEGLITVKTKLPDAMAAAHVNKLIVDQIQDYVIGYRIEKAKQTLDFVLSQYEQAKERYNEAQRELAYYTDQNVNLSTALARTSLEDLQNERNLRFAIYNSLSQQVEQARLKLQEETPVFNILQRPSIPTRTQSGSALLLIITVILGSVLGIVWIFTKRILMAINTHIQN